MTREGKKAILMNLLCRLVFFLACFGICLAFALLSGLVKNDAVRAQYAIILMTFNFLFVGICVTLGADRTFPEFFLFGFLMSILPVIFSPNLRPLGTLFAIAAGVVNGIVVATLYYSLIKLLSWLIVRITAK